MRKLLPLLICILMMGFSPSRLSSSIFKIYTPTEKGLALWDGVLFTWLI
jgi:hypothetical protein